MGLLNLNNIKMELISNYKNAKQAIYDHVGFTEDWVVYPIDDCTEYFWNFDDENVYYADSKDDFEIEDGNNYVDEIYKQRFYTKWVYVGEQFTMIFCDPQVDGMKWFRIFDNAKRMK